LSFRSAIWFTSAIPIPNAWFPPFRCRSAVAVSLFPLRKFRKNYVSAVRIAGGGIV